MESYRRSNDGYYIIITIILLCSNLRVCTVKDVSGNACYTRPAANAAHDKPNFTSQYMTGRSGSCMRRDGGNSIIHHSSNVYANKRIYYIQRTYNNTRLFGVLPIYFVVKNCTDARDYSKRLINVVTVCVCVSVCVRECVCVRVDKTNVYLL